MTSAMVEEKLLKKLERIEELLENLIALQGCVAGAHRHKLAAWIGIDKGRVSGISTVLKTAEKGKAKA
jgi:hypothetical protein